MTEQEKKKAFTEAFARVKQLVTGDAWNLANSMYYIKDVTTSDTAYADTIKHMLSDLEDTAVRISEGCDAARFFFDEYLKEKTVEQSKHLKDNQMIVIDETSEVNAVSSEELERKIQKRVSGKLEFGRVSE